MATKPRPKTEFPSPDALAGLAVHEKNINDSRYTRFPGGLDIEKLLIAETTELRIVEHSKREEAVQTVLWILL